MNIGQEDLDRYIRSISQSGKSIYDFIEIGDPDLWIPSPHLQEILDTGLKGFSLAGLPLRTRSKIAKQKVCEILGYPIPKSFKKTQPRFPGQNFDTYAQKSNNLQVWNEELSATRRYVIIKISANDIVEQVKVVPGSILADLDTTGTLTQKYQAKVDVAQQTTGLISQKDSANLNFLEGVRERPHSFFHSPTKYPKIDYLLTIDMIYERLRDLIADIEQLF